MTLLSRALLSPIYSEVSNPFTAILETLDAAVDKDFAPTWHETKRMFALRLFNMAKLSKKLSQQAPNFLLEDAILDIRSAFDYSAYFTSQFWRAFYYYLNTGSLNPRWPQFGIEEAKTLHGLLTTEELDIIKQNAKNCYSSLFDNQIGINSLFKQIRPQIIQLCKKRATFLSWIDPAVYSHEDVVHQTYCNVLKSLRTSDYFTDDPQKMAGWAIKCADNSLHDLIDTATAAKRNRLVNGTQRECDLAIQNEDGEGDWETLRLQGSNPFSQPDYIEDTIFYHQIIARAKNPKIKSYLQIVCGEEHNFDFWSWLSYTKPKLSRREAFVTENPKVLGSWVQRWLDLPTGRLISFLRTEVPELVDAVKEPQRTKLCLAL